MIDREFIGFESPSYDVVIEEGRLRFFAAATGQDLPLYTDPEAARAAGFPALPVPLTFPFCVEMERPAAFEMLKAMRVPLGKVLHGEQSFRYLRPICAGDRITVRSKVLDLKAKKGGALELIVRESTLSHSDGEPSVVMRAVVVVRHGEGEA